MLSGECVDVEEHGSCKEDLAEHVDDVHSCEYHVRFNTCEEDSEECSVEIVVGDHTYNFEDCEEAEEHFDLPDCTDEMEEGSCMELV